MTLHLYLARRLVWIFLGLLACFCAFFMLVDMVEQLRRFHIGTIGFSRLMQLTLLSVPQSVYQLLPLVVMLSGIVLCHGLAHSGELVVMRASGRSALGALLSPMVVAGMLGIATVSTLNPIAAATTQRYHHLSELMRTGGRTALSINREGLWLRQADPLGQTVIHAQSANADASVLYDVTFIVYAQPARPVRRIHAKVATLNNGSWELNEAKVWPLMAGINPEGNAAEFSQMRLPSGLTHARILDGFGAPNSISIWNLPDFIDQLERAGLSVQRYRAWLQIEIAQPLFFIALMMIAAAFTMRPARFRRAAPAILAAIFLGFMLYYVRNFAQILGENGQVPATLAAWTPPLAGILLALGLLLHNESG